MGERQRKADQREQAERKLLEAALELVALRGSFRMSLADVGAHAGFSRALPAHYFGNKEGLVSALVGFMLNRFRSVFVRGPKPKQGRAAVLHRVASYIHGAREEPAQFRALQILMAEASTDAGSPSLSESLVAANQSALAYFEHQIRVGIAQGEIDPATEPRAGAVVILGTMRGVLAQWFLAPEQIDLAAALGEFERMLLAAFAPRTGAAPG